MIATELFGTILGNEPVKKFLSRMIQDESSPNLLLFAGPDGIGKALFAKAYAKAILGDTTGKVESGNHPDFFTYLPEGKIGLHSIDTMRRLTQDACSAPYESARKVIVLHDADRMQPAAANALLKTLEEPAITTILIFLTSSPDAILPTILSRARRINFAPIAREILTAELISKRGLPEPQAATIAALSEGSLATAMKLAESGFPEYRLPLITALAQGGIGGVDPMIALVGVTADHLSLSKEEDKELPEGAKNMSAAQRDAIEKQAAGVLSLAYFHAVDGFLYQILSWYRDVALLQAGGDKQLLVNQDLTDQFTIALKRGVPANLDRVQRVLGDVRTMVSRSMSLDTCLEVLFLRLGL